MKKLIERYVYMSVMVLDRLTCYRHKDQVMKNGNIDLERVMKINYLHEFDREIQCPTWGYPTEGAYYRDASSADALLGVKIPLFAIHAQDDPVGLSHLETPKSICLNSCSRLLSTRLCRMKSSK